MASRLTAGVFSSGSDEWGTPKHLFDLLDYEFGFGVDTCAASAAIAKCPRFYSPADDGLAQVWPVYAGIGSNSACWCNPPYSTIGQWMKKAHAAAMAGSLVVLLVPARTDTRWMWNYGRAGELRILPGRLKFADISGDGGQAAGPAPWSALPLWPDLLLEDDDPAGDPTSAPFPSCVIVMRPGLPGAHSYVWFWDYDQRYNARSGLVGVSSA